MCSPAGLPLPHFQAYSPWGPWSGWPGGPMLGLETLGSKSGDRQSLLS